MLWRDKRGAPYFLLPLLYFKTCCISSLDLLLHMCLSERCKMLLWQFSIRDAGIKLPGTFLFFPCPPPPPPQQSTPSRPPIPPHSFFLRMHRTCGSLGERRGPRMRSQNFHWLPVDELGRGRDKTHDPETGSRQGGDPRLESWRMFGEEDAAVGARAAS